MLPQRILLIVFMITLAACNVVTTLLQSPERQIGRAETVTYRDQRFNYEFDYPASWVVEEIPNMTMLFSSKPDANLPAGDYIPVGETKIDIYPSDFVNSTPFSDYVTQQLEAMQPGNCLIYDDPVVYTLNGGGQAVEANIFSDMGPDVIVYAELEGRYFVFAAYGDAKAVREIVRSLRPISPIGYDENESAFSEIHVERNKDCFLP